MKNPIKAIWKYWKENTKDDLKTTVHYFRYWSLTLMLWAVAGLILYPITYGVEAFTSPVYLYDILFLILMTVVHIISKLIIKRNGD